MESDDLILSRSISMESRGAPIPIPNGIDGFLADGLLFRDGRLVIERRIPIRVYKILFTQVYTI